MIGVLDTGIGGLAVVRRIRQQLTDVDIVYLGDNVRGMMALRSPQAAAAFVQVGQRFLTTRGAGLIVLACPVEAPPPQAGDPPRLDTVAAAAQTAARLASHGKIAVIEASGGRGGAYETRIRALCPEARVYAHPTPLLEALIEAGWLHKPETARILRRYLHPLKVRQIDALVLGSGHYGVLRPMIARKLGKRVAIVEAAEALAGAWHCRVFGTTTGNIRDA